MAFGIKLIPTKGINLDLANQYMQPNQAYFIKNLYYSLSDEAEGGMPESAREGLFKDTEGNALYCPLALPKGENITIGSLSCKETSSVYVFVWNSLNNHTIFRVNGKTQTADIVKIDSNFNFQLDPQYFIGRGQAWLEVVFQTNPATGEVLTKQDLYWTDGNGYQGYLRVDDCIATNGFDKTIYPYFLGDYDPAVLIRMGIPTLDDCIGITEVPFTSTDNTLGNELLYRTFKFRVSGIDVFGRPTEHGIISYYVSGLNDCISKSGNVPRCLQLVVKVGNPLIDKLNLEYLIDNGTVWYTDATYSLYEGSNVGKWWLRQRNTSLSYNPATYEYTFTFCNTGEHDPIDIKETTRQENPLPQSSQALFKLNTKLALANNRNGFNPLDVETKKMFSIKAILPKAKFDTDLVSITVYCPIYNPFRGYYIGVFDNGTSGFTWGGGGVQYFANKAQSGFWGYLNDGDSAISTQVYFDAASGTWIDDPNHSHTNGFITMQKFVFNNKKKGYYTFNIASHSFDPSTQTDFASTSTFIYGVSDLLVNSLPNGTLPLSQPKAQSVYNSQQLLIDCTKGSYSTLDTKVFLIIADLLFNNSLHYGYVYETQIGGANALPVELCHVTSSQNCISSNSTDKNGFYWAAFKNSGARSCSIIFSYKGLQQSISFVSSGGGLTNYVLDQYPSKTNATWADYYTLQCNRVLVSGNVSLKGTNIGVSNAKVVLTNGGEAYTDENGNFTLIAHDYIPESGIAKTRNDFLVFSSPCIYFDANTNVAILDISVSFNRFNPPSPFSDSQRAISTNGWALATAEYKGLLSGGTYGLGIRGADWLGRRTYVQDLGTFTVPSLWQTKVVAPSEMQLSINANVNLPLNWAWFSFCITSELTISERLEWIIDSVDFIDNTGTKTTVNPTQIKIGYASISEYNKQNNFSTNCAWQFLVEGQTTPIVGDKVQFLINGDGTIFDTTIISQVKYDSNGQYFLIDYKPSLKNLKASGKIRLIRPRESFSEAEPYYEICGTSVNVVNGKPQIFELPLGAFDTYYLARSIPVPTTANNQTETIAETVSSTTGGITTMTTKTTTVNVAYTNELRTVGYYFEHNSPSDFWGTKCWNYGRAGIKNPYEAETIDYNQICLSGVQLQNGSLSYLQYFDTANFKTFDVPNTLGIVAGIPFQGGVLFICQTNNFTVGYGDNLVRQTIDGTLATAGAASSFGLPQRKIGSDYGLLLKDKSALAYKQGEVYFLDTKRTAVVVHNFNEALPISEYNENNSTIYSWLIKKINYVDAWNASNPKNKRYFHFGYNPANDELLLSDFTLHTGTYVNNERTYNIALQETFAWDTLAKIWKGHYSFTPEYYSFLEGEVLGQDQMFTFKNGLPYAHNFTNKTGLQFNTFYGIPCNKVFHPIVSADGFKEKIFLCMEVYCPQCVYFADLITTQTGQVSRLLKSQFKKGKYVWQAAFLQDLNTPIDPNYNSTIQSNPLFEGNPLFGTWISLRLVGDPSLDGNPSELFGVTVFAYPSEKSGT
jgi:hypothetical protein